MNSLSQNASENNAFSLPESERKRLTRSEMSSMMWVYNVISAAGYAWDDLRARFNLVPDGEKRFQDALNALTSIIADLNGTIPEQQKLRILRTMKDMEVRMTPKATPFRTEVLMTKEQGKTLVDYAQNECNGCIRDGEECRKCKLYSVLEAIVPLDDYGPGFLCPYSRSEWG